MQDLLVNFLKQGGAALKQSGILKEIAHEIFLLQKAESQQESATIKADIEEPITIDDACAIYKISRVTLYNWRKQGLITVHGMGRRKYLYKSELMENLKQPKKFGSRSIRGLSQCNTTIGNVK